MVNVMPQLWGAQTFGQNCSGCFCGGASGWGLAFKLVAWVKQIDLLNGSGPPPVSWGPEKNKKPTSSLSKRESFLPGCLQMGTCLFVCLFFPYLCYLPPSLRPGSMFNSSLNHLRYLPYPVPCSEDGLSKISFSALCCQINLQKFSPRGH